MILLMFPWLLSPTPDRINSDNDSNDGLLDNEKEKNWNYILHFIGLTVNIVQSYDIKKPDKSTYYLVNLVYGICYLYLH
jgi:hypothetical protein